MNASLMIVGNDADWHYDLAHLPDVKNNDTLPKILRHNATLYPDGIAQREKDLGIWNSVRWQDFDRHVANMAVAFASFGVGKDDVVALIGDNRPEWVWGEIAAHATRAMSMGIYRDALEEEIFYLVDQTKPKIVVAEDEEQIDKLLNLGDRIPSITHIIYHDARGMRKYDDPRLMFLEDLEKIGADLIADQPGIYDQLIAKGSGEDIGILCTTSGTTAHPKLAMWKNSAFIGHAVNYLKSDPKGPGDEYIAVLPLSWVMEQMYSVGWCIIARMTVNFSENEETAMADLREIGPSFVLFSPRVWEMIAADVHARMMESSAWKQAIYNWAEKRGMKAMNENHRDALADAFAFRALRDSLGFSNLTSAATGGAAMGPDTFKYFQAIGVPLKQLYGQTEGLGAYTIHHGDDVDYDTVGMAFPESTIKIRNPDSEGLGEILIKHPNMMSGYFHNEEETAKSFDDDGFFQTGDAGYINDSNHLVVIDRIKDLSETSQHVRFSPQFIENKIKFSAYIAEAVILGKDQPYLTALICLRYPIVSKWAEQRRIAFTTYTDLSAQPEVYDLMRREIIKVNASLPHAQHIKKFVLLYKELDADDGELTRTRKVRRGAIAEKYGDIIDMLYSDADKVDIDTVIHFQDGTKQRIRTRLKVQKLEEEKELEHEI